MSAGRVSFDSNAGDPETGYLLRFDLSRRDLARLAVAPAAGLRVTIYMPDELEAEATLHFDPELDCWRAVPMPGTMRALG